MVPPSLFCCSTWLGWWDDLPPQPGLPGLQTGGVGWGEGHTALPPDQLSALLAIVCLELGWAGIRLCPAIGPGFPSSGWGPADPCALTAGAKPVLCCCGVPSPQQNWVGGPGEERASEPPAFLTSQWLSLLCPAADGSSAAAGTGHHVPGLRGLHLL